MWDASRRRRSRGDQGNIPILPKRVKLSEGYTRTLHVATQKTTQKHRSIEHGILGLFA